MNLQKLVRCGQVEHLIITVPVYLSADVNDIIKYSIAYKNLSNQILQCSFDSHLSYVCSLLLKQSRVKKLMEGTISLGTNFFYVIFQCLL